MSFLQPLAFLGLLLLIPVILLYLLKQRRRRVTVSTLLFWDEILRDEHRVASITRLRKILSLLLQLLVLLLLILALARPILAKDTLGARRIVILLDTSASMLVSEGAATRFDQAVEKARDVIAGMASGDTAMLVAAGAHPQVAMPFTASRRTLLEALGAIAPDHTGTNFGAALDILQQLPPDERETCVYVISDGAFDAVPFAPPEGMRFAYLPTGEASENVGITAFQVRPLPALPRDFEILFEVANETDADVTLPFELHVGEDLVDADEITIPARGTYRHSMRQFSAAGGAVRLAIDRDDPLPVDNEAYAVLPPVVTVSVALVTEGNYFLESALLTDDGIALTTIAPADYAARAAALDVPVYIFDNWAPETPPDAHAIYIGQWPATVEVAAEGELADPIVTTWDRDHPVNRHLSVTNIAIETARRLSAPESFTPLMESFDQPLVLLHESGAHMTMVVAFNTSTSDLPLRVAFPILIANTIRHMTGGVDADTWAGLKMGAVLGPEALARYAVDATIVRVRAPGEAVEAVEAVEAAEGSSPLSAVSVDLAGIYSGVTASGDVLPLFGASLSNPREVDIAVSDELPVTSETPLMEIPDEFRIGAAPWRLLAFAALALMLFEWICFHRRLVE